MTHPPPGGSPHRARSAFSGEARGTPACPRWCGAGRGGVTVRETRTSSFPTGAVMGIWIVWLIAAAVLGVAELVTMTLALGLIAVGAVAAAGVGAAGGNGVLQFGAFIVASLAGVVGGRPIALRHPKPPPLLRNG